MQKETITLVGSVSSHLGYSRKSNADNFLLQGDMNGENAPVMETASIMRPLFGQWHCFAVFDGMGAGNCGEDASWLAVKAISNLPAGGAPGSEEICTLARQAFREAGERIRRRSRPGMYGSAGTTVFTDGEWFRVFHLGGSRAYLYRLGALFQLTRDHTLAAEKLSLGYYSADDPRIARERHQLTAFIGSDREPEESDWLKLLPGDRLLLCTDGLFCMCSDEEIRETLRASVSPIEAAWKLTERALRAGGRDNVTCLVVGRDAHGTS